MYAGFSFKAHISQLLQQASKRSLQTGRSLNALGAPWGPGTSNVAGKLLWEGDGKSGSAEGAAQHRKHGSLPVIFLEEKKYGSESKEEETS